MRSIALTALLVATPTAAQITVSVGPDPAPLGAPVFISVTNDTNLIAGLGGCPWRVLDATEQVVFVPHCLITEVLIGPLGTMNYRWNQVDQSGVQVPPGRYLLDVSTPIGNVRAPVTIGGVDANLHLKGTPAIGTNVIGLGGRPVAVSSPQDPGALFRVLGAFASTPGFETCGGVLPLSDDPLFRAILRGGVLRNAVGTLDASGFAETTLLPIPDDPALIGVDFVLAFLVLDPAASCPVARISEPLALTIAPGPAPFPR